MLVAVEVALTLLEIKDQALLVAVMEDQETQPLLQLLPLPIRDQVAVVQVDLKLFCLVALEDRE
jgi:hypothetical protein